MAQFRPEWFHPTFLLHLGPGSVLDHVNYFFDIFFRGAQEIVCGAHYIENKGRVRIIFPKVFLKGQRQFTLP